MRKLIKIKGLAGEKLGACSKCNYLKNAHPSVRRPGEYNIDCPHRKVKSTLPQMVASPEDCLHNPDRKIK